VAQKISWPGYSIKVSAELKRSKFHGTTQRFNSQLVCVTRTIREKMMMDAISLTAYHASSWREKLVIKQSGSGYFKESS